MQVLCKLQKQRDRGNGRWGGIDELSRLKKSSSSLSKLVLLKSTLWTSFEKGRGELLFNLWESSRVFVHRIALLLSALFMVHFFSFFYVCDSYLLFQSLFSPSILTCSRHIPCSSNPPCRSRLYPEPLFLFLFSLPSRTLSSEFSLYRSGSSFTFIKTLNYISFLSLNSTSRQTLSLSFHSFSRLPTLQVLLSISRSLLSKPNGRKYSISHTGSLVTEASVKPFQISDISTAVNINLSGK